MIHLADLDKPSLFYYTAKWFLIWTSQFLCIGIMAILAVFAFFLAVCKPDTSEKTT